MRVAVVAVVVVVALVEVVILTGLAGSDAEERLLGDGLWLLLLLLLLLRQATIVRGSQLLLLLLLLVGEESTTGISGVVETGSELTFALVLPLDASSNRRALLLSAVAITSQ